MKILTSLQLVTALLVGSHTADFAFAQQPSPVRACRSVHLWWQPTAAALAAANNPADATAFYNEVTVEKSTRGSYFAVCGFSKGYFGIQELANGQKVVIFSVWEPGEQDDPNAPAADNRAQVVVSGEGVRVRRFGGEGTGGQSFYDYDWAIDETVRFVVFAKADGPQRTQYAGYVYIAAENRWQHLATFSTLSQGHLLRGYYSFVEDFLRNGESAKVIHRARYGNGWIQVATGGAVRWLPLTRARFTADSTPSTTINSGVAQDRFFLQTGGETQNSDTPLRDTRELASADRKPPLDLPQPFLDAHSTNTLRVLAYNVKHGRGNDGVVDLERIAQVIRQLNPDVVALQEIDRVADRSGDVDQTAELARLTGLRHHAFGDFFDFQGGQYGMAILSRYPLTNQTNLRLPDGAEPRTSLVATVSAPQPFRLASVHFYRTEAERLAQARTLLEFLDQHRDMPCIVAGDFNSQPDSPVLDLFEEFHIPAKGEDRLTFSSDKPRVEIDFVMHRPKAAYVVQAIDVVDEPVASDHRPLTVDLEIPGQPAEAATSESAP